jgi:catechol 2,3-dioxygenase-like lactoylglutathione lyase family enzyme
MVRVVGADHLVLSVGDFEKSKAFYAPLMEFLGFGVEAEYADMMGWANGRTLFWIAAADAEGKKHKYRKGDIGFHHYAFRLRSRKDVDALQAFLEEQGTELVEPAGEYYDDYYAVFFLDPDGMKLEGMHWGERQAAAKKRAAPKGQRNREGPRNPAKVSLPGYALRAGLAKRRENAHYLLANNSQLQLCLFSKEGSARSSDGGTVIWARRCLLPSRVRDGARSA